QTQPRHAVLSSVIAYEHVPAPLQVPASWHWSGGAQVKAVPPHVPPVQTSFFVHSVPSLHAVPSDLSAYEQVPSPLQVPASWHWSGGAQVKAVPAHVPPVQTSFCVHAVPSLQVVPSGLSA